MRCAQVSQTSLKNKKGRRNSSLIKKWFCETEETHQNWSEIEAVASAVNNQKSMALSLYQSNEILIEFEYLTGLFSIPYDSTSLKTPRKTNPAEWRSIQLLWAIGKSVAFSPLCLLCKNFLLAQQNKTKLIFVGLIGLLYIGLDPLPSGPTKQNFTETQSQNQSQSNFIILKK